MTALCFSSSASASSSGLWMRSFTRHICSVFPPSPELTLAIVHGSNGFHWKSDTCDRCPAC